MRTAIIALLAGCVAFLLVFALQVSGVRAHSFYEWRCCSDQDCGPVPDAAVEETPDGYVVKFPNGRRELVPYADKRIKFTPPDVEAQYHICTVGGRLDGMLLCIYVPGRGT